MNDTERQMREAVIEFASQLYGATWRDQLAEKAGVPKRIMADYFNSDRALPQNIPLSILRAMESHLDEKMKEQDATRRRVVELRRELILASTKIETSDARGGKGVRGPSQPYTLPLYARRRVRAKPTLRLVVPHETDRTG